jgi:hypothetical protein
MHPPVTVITGTRGATHMRSILAEIIGEDSTKILEHGSAAQYNRTKIREQVNRKKVKKVKKVVGRQNHRSVDTDPFGSYV